MHNSNSQRNKIIDVSKIPLFKSYDDTIAIKLNNDALKSLKENNYPTKQGKSVYQKNKLNEMEDEIDEEELSKLTDEFKELNEKYLSFASKLGL
ncbi:uncharacterized protein ASCRUDRAFT_75992 [Ascoidea rubescens DSM 1968]|uniref:Uncharacterized protein n=1 Tax=Ascoidea rubescens DSM 1968 TaxID=1344418 RepID=A0A1D2VI13_9ASCO|nr:hypothetical protein ASCRUDRAFT_75992 [Ascoidea rubescens DSM 1968]ODV61301.1 hypothetical protein ASCRUDRAFT_75992 [Ascoidea rubescens DSM 1968]